jgi:hypothetical protein
MIREVHTMTMGSTEILINFTLKKNYHDRKYNSMIDRCTHIWMVANVAQPCQFIGHTVQFFANCYPNSGQQKLSPVYCRAHDLVEPGQVLYKQPLSFGKCRFHVKY